MSLLDAAAGGDPRAVDELYRLYRPFAVQAAERKVRREADVDDVAQEALLALIKGLPGLRHRTDEAVKAYLAKAVTSSASHLGRGTGAAISSGTGPDDGLRDMPAEVEDPVTRQDLAMAATTAVGEFRDHDIEVAGMLVQGLSPKEIAETLGIKVTTVYKWRLRLRALIVALIAHVDVAPDTPPSCRAFQASLATYLESRLPGGSHALGCPTCADLLADRRDRLYAFSHQRLPLAGVIGAGAWRLRHLLKAHPVLSAAGALAGGATVAIALAFPTPRHAEAVVTPPKAQAPVVAAVSTTSTTTATTTTTTAPPPTATTTITAPPVVVPPTTTIVTTPDRTSQIEASWTSVTMMHGQPVDLTATVTGNVNGTQSIPTGTIEWMVNGTQMSSMSVPGSGVVQWTWTPPQAGSYTVTASLVPTGGYPSASATTTVKVS